MQQIDSLLLFTCCISHVTIVCVICKCLVSKMLADAFTFLCNDSFKWKVVASFWYLLLTDYIFSVNSHQVMMNFLYGAFVEFKQRVIAWTSGHCPHDSWAIFRNWQLNKSVWLPSVIIKLPDVITISVSSWATKLYDTWTHILTDHHKLSVVCWYETWYVICRKQL